MNFFWKIFFTTMFVSVCCFSVGGYFLINANFQAAMEQEVNVAYDLGDIVHYSLNNELKNLEELKAYSSLRKGERGKFVELDWISRKAELMSINNANGIIPFCIVSKDIGILFSSHRYKFNKQIISHLSEQEKGYTLHKTEEGVFLQALRPTKLLNKQCYIEIVKDVTYIFANQQRQYQLFGKIILALLIIGGILTMVISKWLIKPINRLTTATKEIATGNFDKRIAVTSEDEFAVLSQNFNIMSHQLEQKIHELKDEADKQELFVAAFSHELKTPLTSIIGYADMLRSKQMNQAKTSLCANYIFEEGKRLETLSMRLLEMVVLKKQEIKCSKVSTTDFFDNIKSLMLPILYDLQISLVLEIEPALIFIEPSLMKTVCLNLLDNARKALGTKGEISVKGKVINNGYKISICDNGKGMEERDLQRITQAFYMVDKSRTRKEGGAGLGLAICDEILKLHNATISFTSKVNVGTCATITLKGVEDDDQMEESS